MGPPWRDHPAWGVVERAEQALGEPLAHLLLAGSADELARTRESQLSVLLTSLVVWEAAARGIPRAGRLRRPLPGPDHRPHRLRGPHVRGRHPPRRPPGRGHPGRRRPPPGADGRRARRRRGPGREACDAAPDECWLANDNAPGQIVIAGTPSGIERASKAAGDLGIRRVMPLKVGGAFHTPLMARGRRRPGSVLAGITFPPRPPRSCPTPTPAPTATPTAGRAPGAPLVPPSAGGGA